MIILYTLFYSRYIFALFKFKNEAPDFSDNELPFLSLIIPVRNESNHLPNLFTDINQQDYPKSRFEVIFINDHSEDNSPDLLRDACLKHHNFQWRSLTKGQNGKKMALHKGVGISSAEWIVQTDADCHLPREFLLSHAERIRTGDFHFIAGPVRITPGRSLWCKIEALEFLSLVASGMASFLIRKPTLCNAANMSYNKHFYFEALDYLPRSAIASGDDIFLLAAAKKLGKNIAFTASTAFPVEVVAHRNLHSFLRQRIRWASKAKHYKDKDQIILTLVVWLTNFGLLSLFSLVFINNQMLIPFIIAFLIKAVVDFIFLRIAARLFRLRVVLPYFPVLAIFYYFYVSIIGVLSLPGKYRWKLRAYTK